MFIQTETTPNPETLKFLPGCTVMGEAPPIDFTDESQLFQSPLAKNLMGITGVKAVFFGMDFITLTKNTDGLWDVIKPLALGAIMEHFVSKAPLVEPDSAPHTPLEQESQKAGTLATASGENQKIIKAIEDLIATRIRPAIARDGGDVILQKYQEGVAYVTLRGACAGCPSAEITLKHGIENFLRHYIPEVKEVQSV